MWGKGHIFLPRAASQDELKQKGKHTCAFPISAYFSLHWLYRLLQLYGV
jgi:hypothetical protein